MVKHRCVWLVLVSACFLICTPGLWAMDQTVLGPNDCQIGSLHLNLSRYTFEVDEPGDGYISIRKTDVMGQVAGGFLFFNSKLIPLRTDLLGEEAVFSKDLILKATNQLTVFLWGTPGASVAIEVKKIASPIPPPEILFTADPLSVIAGATSVLTWQVANADMVTIDNGIGRVPPTSTLTVQPLETTTYTIAALGPGGSTTASLTITVTPLPPTVALNAVPEVINAGETATLSWSSSNADSCVIEPDINEVDASGFVSVTPIETTTYYIVATGPGGMATDSVTVVVTAPRPTVDIMIDPGTILPGKISNLSWHTTNATTCDIAPGIGSVATEGVLAVSPFETTTYTITAAGEGGVTTASATLTVLQPPTVQIQAAPEAVLAGDSVTLNWSSTHADTATIAPEVGSVGMSGSIAVYPLETTTYTITVSGPGGSATANATVMVAFPEPSAALQAVPDTIMAGQAVTLSWHSTDAVSAELTPGIGAVPVDGSLTVWPSEQTVYFITVVGPGGSAQASVQVSVVYPQPTVTLSANPDTIEPGNPTVLTWTASDATSCEIMPGIGNVGLDGSMEIYPSETTSYLITATGPGGSAIAAVTVGVLDPSQPPQLDFSASSTIIALGESTTLSWTTVNGQNAHIDNQIGTVGLNGTMIETPEHTTTYRLTVSGAGGSTSSEVTIRVQGNPEPQPEGAFGEPYEDLVPADATVDAYTPQHFSIITGLVNDLGGLPLSDVAVTILDRPEYGTAFTDLEGRFVLPVEGGATVTVVYRKPDYLTAHRKVYVSWNDIAITNMVALTTEDPEETTMVFDGDPDTIVTHQSTPVIDEYGERSCAMVFAGDNQAFFVDEDGNDVYELSTMTVRATEYRTQASMPAELPPTSAYTYCASLTVEGAQNIRFENPVVTWIDNFLGFDVGLPVPVGFYDRKKGAWEPLENGIVVRLIDTDSDGIVDALDANGDDMADDLDQDGLLLDEVAGLSDPAVYFPGATYWRSELSHFSEVDWNFAIIAESGSTKTTATAKVQSDEKQSEDDPCYNKRGSFTDDRNRVHHEVIPIPGTGMSLHYDSSRTQGYQHVLTVPASGDTVPASLNRIDVEVFIAGRVFAQSLDPLPNQVTQFVWDGLDFRGQPVKGSVTAKVAIGFVYDGVYAVPAPVARSFALAGIQTTGVPARQEVTLWEYSDVTVRKGAGEIAEGWSLSPHHTMSLAELSFLFKGDGTVTNNSAAIIETIAGNGADAYGGDGGPAAAAAISFARGVAVDGAGNVYIADSWNNRIRKIDDTGIITTVAGTGSAGFEGDGGPAVAARINWPYGMTVDDAGNLFIADTYNHRIRKVDANGIITTVAGNGTGGHSGDGGPAIDAALDRPYGVAVDAEGNLFIADTWNNCIRRVSRDGIITAIAGVPFHSGYNGREGMATEILLSSPADVTLDRDGNVYIADSGNGRIMRVDISGYMSTIAGNPWGSGGDGGPAIEAPIYPYGLAVDAEGNVYIADSSFETYGGVPNNRIRKANKDGIITTVAGTGAVGDGGDGGAATGAAMNRPAGLALDAKGNLYFTDSSNYLVRKVGPPSAFSGFDYTGTIFFAEPSGQGHILSSAGRHLATVDLNAGVDRYAFEYDDDNRLTTITDRFDNQISIQRDAGGVPTAIVSPEGLTTVLTIDGNNRLTGITYADTATHGFEYTAGGLLTVKQEPKGNRFEHQYDAYGRLTLDSDQEGGTWQHSVTNHGTGAIQTEVVSAEGNRTTYLDHTDLNGRFTSTITGPTGAQTLFTLSADGMSVSKALPCGMDLAFNYDLDPEYKFRFVRQMQETTPSALERVTQNAIIYTDTDTDDIPDKITRSVAVNGKTTTLVQDVNQAQSTITSPENRTVTIDYDPVTLLTTTLSVPGLLETSYDYNTAGKPTAVTVGTRETEFTYNTVGFLETVTDALDNTTTYSYDPVGRITGVSRPDGSSLGFTYDANGNLTVLTNPSTIDHIFDYNAVNRQNTYDTPLSGAYTYTYDRDRRLTAINFPSGAQIGNFYENGRLIQTQTPEGNIDYTYLCGNKIASITNGTESIAYGYDGNLLTSETVTGELNNTLSYSYNDDFNVTLMTYAGSTTNYTYDNDGLLTGSGSFTIARNSQNGQPEAVTCGGYDLTRAFNGYGEIETQNVTVNGQVISSWTLSRDNNSRIVQRNEMVDGVSAAYAYTYDEMGRLATVTKDGTLIEEYDYDENGTRIYEMNASRGIAGRSYAYDDEDHLLTAGEVAYQYNVDGFLTTKTNGSEVTAYNYSSRGELLGVTLPDDTLIEYTHDPFGRRIAKKINGVIVEKYLWQALTRLLAVYDGTDNLIQRFEYADDRMPVAMTQEGVTYSLAYDQVGSLRVVAEESGIVVKRIDYDAFGNILTDSNTAFTIPFGFAGGLHDRDIGLVRFGYRDYDPDVGRWTAKDPIFFSGESTDLYGYVLNIPTSIIDPFGLEALGLEMIKNFVPEGTLHYSGIKIGGSILFTDYSTQLHSSEDGLFPSTKTDMGVSTTIVGGGTQFVFTASDLSSWDILGDTAITFGIGRYLGISLFPSTSQISLNVGLGVPPVISLSTQIDRVDHRCD